MREEVTVEYYGGPLSINLVGAVKVPAGRANENAKAVGKLLCKVNHTNELQAILIDQEGDEVERMMVYR